MSRTYRTILDWRYHARGNFYDWRDKKLSWRDTIGWCGEYYINRKARDRKPWSKPPKWFKKQNRRWERSKVHQAIREGKEPPHFPKYDSWEWT